MTAAALLLLLAAPTAPTPTPTLTPTAVPKATPVVSSVSGATRTLSDVARERRLAKERDAGASKPAKGGTLSVAPATTPGDSPAVAAPSPAEGESPAEERRARLVVASAAHNGVVGSAGQVEVFGSLRNSGYVPACDVVLTVRIHDDKGQYLSSSVARADEFLVAPNAVVSFRATIQAPPGVAGAVREGTFGAGTTGPSATLEGRWRMLGDRVDVSVTSFSEKCFSPNAERDDAKAAPN